MLFHTGGIIFVYILIYTSQGAITKRMTAIEEMAGMDVLCSDKTGTLTLNKLTVDKNLVEVLIFCSLNSIFPLATRCASFILEISCRFLSKESMQIQWC